MDFDTKQQPKKKKNPNRGRKSDGLDDQSDYLLFHGRHYSNCLDYVKDYAPLKNLVITYVELPDEDVPKPLYEVIGFDWQVWRKDYGVILKEYCWSDLLDKTVRVWDNTLDPPRQGFTRLYRAIPEKDLPIPPKPKKAKKFVKEAPAVVS